MKRYYVCKIIGDGLSPDSAFRPAISDIIDPKTGTLAFVHSAVMPPIVNGAPEVPWCLVIAGGQDHKLAESHQDITKIPDFSLDIRLSAMQTATKMSMFNALTDRGIDVSDISNAEAMRDLIRSLGRKIDPDFSENRFDVIE